MMSFSGMFGCGRVTSCVKRASRGTPSHSTATPSSIETGTLPSKSISTPWRNDRRSNPDSPMSHDSPIHQHDPGTPVRDSRRVLRRPRAAAWPLPSCRTSRYRPMCWPGRSAIGATSSVGAVAANGDSSSFGCSSCHCELSVTRVKWRRASGASARVWPWQPLP